MWFCHRCHWSGFHDWDYLIRAAAERERIEAALDIVIDILEGVRQR